MPDFGKTEMYVYLTKQGYGKETIISWEAKNQATLPIEVEN